MSQYITPEKLRELILAARASGQASAELVGAITKIAMGRIARVKTADVEDAIQEAVLNVLVHLDKIDLAKNPFSYITTACWRKFLALQRKEATERRKLTRLADRQRRDDKDL